MSLQLTETIEYEKNQLEKLSKGDYSIDELCEILGFKLSFYQKILLDYLTKNPSSFIYYSGIRSHKYYFNSIYEIMRIFYKQGDL